jgi:large repetitive protein
LTPTTTSVSTPPATSLIAANQVYGAQVTDSAGVYVAIFSTSSAAASVSYTSTHPGPGMHVVSNLRRGEYVVTQNGTALSGQYATDKTGAIAFHENGGGSFQIALANGTLGITGDSLPVAQTNLAYAASLPLSGGLPPYSCSITAGALPPGLSMSAGGTVSGLPLLSGTTQLTVGCSSADSQFVAGTVNLTVKTPAVALSGVGLHGVVIR